MIVIQVILPLRLDWEPYYFCKDDSVRIGDRVTVAFGCKIHTAVVSSVSDKEPADCGGRIMEITGKTDLPPVSPQEIELWKFVSSYYLCSIGEVYKAAYPSGRTASEMKKSRKTITVENRTMRRFRMDDPLADATRKIIEGMDSGKTVLLRCDEGRWRIYSELIRRTLEEGKDALLLTPGETSLIDSRALEYYAGTSFAKRREISELLRTSQTGQLVQGGRIAVFLPFRKLGLVIVDEEQSADYKQDSPAPRYNGRDTALALARIHGASAVIGSPAPSLESWYNAISGKFESVEVNDSCYYKAEIIDMKAEARKNGVPGEYFSRKLLSAMEPVLAAKGRILILLPWTDTSDAEIEARKYFPKAGAKLVFKPLRKATDNELEKFDLVAFIRADYLLSKQDFKADERMLQTLCRLCGRCLRLIVQTSRAEHPVFSQEDGLLTALLEERRRFGAPPFTRDVAVYEPVTDDYEGTVRFIRGRRYSETHHFLPKDRTLPERKKQLAFSVSPKGIIDVDPA